MLREVLAIWRYARHVWGEEESRVELGSIELDDGTVRDAKIKCQEGELQEGCRYLLLGQWSDTKYGKQLKVSSFVLHQPVDEESVVAYLKCCRGRNGGVTPRIAAELYDQYGVDAITELMANPEAVSDSISHWPVDKALVAAQTLHDQDHKRHSKMALMRLFNGRGFPQSAVDQALLHWGVAAASRIKEDPYLLMDLKGIGFLATDKMYCDLARQNSSGAELLEKLSSIRRQSMCAYYAVRSKSDGSTWCNEQEVYTALYRAVGLENAKPAEAIEWCVEDHRLVKRGNDLALFEHAHQEKVIAQYVTNNAHECVWPTAEQVSRFSPEGKDLSSHQLQAIGEALRQPVGCLQGSPGVGKTFALACIVKCIVATYGSDSVAVATPTGKAAVRVKQALLDNNLRIEAMTIHRILGVRSKSGAGWSFVRNRSNKLPHSFIVVDESSMCDTSLMASLLEACDSETHVLLVGDIHQLAPVGHGKPFEDLQQIVPTGHLTEIRRNSGRIVKACAEIRDHRRFRASEEMDLEGSENMPLITVGTPERQIVVMQNLIDQLEDVCDPAWDVQVVTAMNDRSEISRKNLNTRLQELLNPHGRRIRGTKFKVKDKVVCLKNGNYLDAEDRDERQFVANGELAQVVDEDGDWVYMRLDDPGRKVKVKRTVESAGFGLSECWDLGYCLSTHRSQGSQWRFVIVMIDSTGVASRVQTRNWIYTAISRAEDATFVVGSQEACDMMMPRDGTSHRKTLLVEQTKLIEAADKLDYRKLFAKV